MHTLDNLGRLTKHLPFPHPPQEVQEGEKEKKDEDKEKEKKKEAEPNFQLLENPARVMPAQLKVLIMPESCRYQPFKPVGASGQSRGVRGPACSVKSLTSQLTINRGSNVVLQPDSKWSNTLCIHTGYSIQNQSN